MINSDNDPQDFHSELSDLATIGLLKSAYEMAKQGFFEEQPTFLKAISNKNPAIRIEAAAMLGRIGAQWAVDPLGTLLGDDDSDVRNEAIFALLETCRLTAVPWLIKSLGDPDEERREDGRVALAALLGDSISHVTNFTLPSEKEVKRVEQWWQAESSKFKLDLCYAWGRPVSLGAWIARLEDAPDDERNWLIERLNFWTGIFFDPPSSQRQTTQWKAWWKENKMSFYVGLRYFYGKLVPT